jgi:hypothetical protein
MKTLTTGGRFWQLRRRQILELMGKWLDRASGH